MIRPGEGRKQKLKVCSVLDIQYHHVHFFCFQRELGVILYLDDQSVEDWENTYQNWLSFKNNTNKVAMTNMILIHDKYQSSERDVLTSDRQRNTTK